MPVLRLFASAREAAGLSVDRIDGGTVGEVLTPECLPESLRDWSPSPPAGAAPGGGFDPAAHVRQLLRSGETDVYRWKAHIRWMALLSP